MNTHTIGPKTSETITWQWFNDDPEAHQLTPPAQPQGAGWYTWCDDGPWMPTFLSFRDEWEEAIAWEYQSIMRYWPGEA